MAAMTLCKIQLVWDVSGFLVSCFSLRSQVFRAGVSGLGVRPGAAGSGAGDCMFILSPGSLQTQRGLPGAVVHLGFDRRLTEVHHEYY